MSATGPAAQFLGCTVLSERTLLLTLLRPIKASELRLRTNHIMTTLSRFLQANTGITEIMVDAVTSGAKEAHIVDTLILRLVSFATVRHLGLSWRVLPDSTMHQQIMKMKARTEFTLHH